MKAPKRELLTYEVDLGDTVLEVQATSTSGAKTHAANHLLDTAGMSRTEFDRNLMGVRLKKGK